MSAQITRDQTTRDQTTRDQLDLGDVKAQRARGARAVCRISASIALSLTLSLTLFGALACDEVPPKSLGGEEAGAAAGLSAGELAGTSAGATAGELAGVTTGELAGVSAGELAGMTAGELAGTTAGATAGELAGTTAGELAGATAGGEELSVEPAAPLEASESPRLELTQLLSLNVLSALTLGERLFVQTSLSEPLLSAPLSEPQSLEVVSARGEPLVSATPIQSAQLTTDNTTLHLLLADGVLYAVRGAEAQRSPLMERVEGRVTSVSAYEGELWLLNDHATLYRWREGSLRAVHLADQLLTPLAQACEGGCEGSFALGARFRGVRALWLALAGELFVLEIDHPELRVWRLAQGLPLELLSADASGALWATGEGLLYRRSPSGRWGRYTLPTLSATAPLEGAQWLSARPERQLVWLKSAQGLWALVGVGEDLLLWPLSRAPLTEGSEGAAALSAALLGEGAEGARGVLLSDAQEVAWAWSEAGLFELMIDEASLPEPPAPPTWLSEVQPLTASRCGACHAEGGLAHHLETREQWVSEFERALQSVERAQMPLGAPPLSEAELTLLRAWREGGFQ